MKIVLYCSFVVMILCIFTSDKKMKHTENMKTIRTKIFESDLFRVFIYKGRKAFVIENIETGERYMSSHYVNECGVLINY